MDEYHKIQTLFARDPETKFKTLLPTFSLPEFEFLQDCKWIFTEKVDGTNIRVNVDPIKGLTFGGRTDNAQIPAKLIQVLREIFDPLTARLQEDFPYGVTFYGEGYGAKIQNGGKYRPDPSFVLFDVRVGSWWLERNNIANISQTYSLDLVPIVGTGNLDDLVDFCSIGFKSHWGDFLAEGVVARPTVELFSRKGERIITKLKYKDFLD